MCGMTGETGSDDCDVATYIHGSQVTDTCLSLAVVFERTDGLRCYV